MNFLKFLLIGGILLNIGSSIEWNGVKDLCLKTPPSLWCGNLSLAQECGWISQCLAYKKAVYNKPIELTLLYESLCPACQSFIKGELNQLLKQFPESVLQLELIPYGNARIKDGEIQCQHGPDECKANKFEGCAIDSLGEVKEYFPFILCIEEGLSQGETLEDIQGKCFEKLKIGDNIQRMIQSCMVSSLGNKLQLKYAERTNNVYPDTHLGVPWLVFNNISLVPAQFLMGSLPGMICQWYKGDQIPSICGMMKSKRLQKYRGSTCSRHDFF